jgi:hypothetical protein
MTANLKLSIKHATADSIKHLPASDRLPIYAYLRLLAPGILEGIGRFLYLVRLAHAHFCEPIVRVLGKYDRRRGTRYYYDVSKGLKQTYSGRRGEDHPYFNSGDGRRCRLA